MAYALEIKDVHKTFNPGTINEKIALDGVNLFLKNADQTSRFSEDSLQT